MFYETHKNNHGLRFNPFKSCVVPRPIAWISTISRGGIVNLAPHSQSNILGWDPPYVMFSAHARDNGQRSDSVANAEATRQFAYNMATYDLREAVALTGAIEEPGIDEMAAAGLTAAASHLIKPPRVKESPVNMECEYMQTIVLPCDTPGLFNSVVIGRVLGIHIADDVIGADGKVDILKIRPLSRMGYLDYTSVTDIFEVNPAGKSDAPSETMIRGMSGGDADPRAA